MNHFDFVSIFVRYTYMIKDNFTNIIKLPFSVGILISYYTEDKKVKYDRDAFKNLQTKRKLAKHVNDLYGKY